MLDNSNSPFTKWFPGGELSVCYNAVDRHVDEGHGDQPALVWDSPITGNKDTVTYAQLQDKVARLARIGTATRDVVGLSVSNLQVRRSPSVFSSK